MLKIVATVLVGSLVFAVVSVAAAKQAHRKQSAQERYAFYKTLYARLEKGETRKKLEDSIPALDRNMRVALAISKTFWTRSTTYDELAKTEILPKEILTRLGIPFDVTSGVIHVPAGLMHTYGYLFSQLETRFGLKGKRWVEGRLDERMGLPPGTFSPFAASSRAGGEFLSNLTQELKRAVSGQNKTAPHFGYLAEKVTWKTVSGFPREADIRTHLVNLKLLAGMTTTDVKLLVYEVRFKGEKPKFVTAFPVSREFVDGIVSQKPGTAAEFRPRYNLYVDPSWKTVNYENLGFRMSSVDD